MKKEQIELLQKLKEARSRLEKQAEELKRHENLIKADILMELDKQGLDAIKECGYTLSRKHNLRCEIADHAALQLAMYNLMTQAKADGRPLQDGMLFQRTVSKTAVTDLLKAQLGLLSDDALDPNSPQVRDAAHALGVRLVDNVDLSVRKS